VIREAPLLTMANLVDRGLLDQLLRSGALAHARPVAPSALIRVMKVLVASRSAPASSRAQGSLGLRARMEDGVVRPFASGPRPASSPADEARERFWLDLTASTALADHSCQELTKAIVRFLDVREHAYARMVRMAGRKRPCSAGERSELYRQSVRARRGPTLTNAR
jgi:hypothetical protein